MPPKDPIAQMHALMEGLRLEMHDAFSEMHEQMAAAKPAPVPPPGHDVAGLIAAAAMLEGRIKTGEDAMHASLAEATKPRTDEATLKAIADLGDVMKQVLSAVSELAKAMGKPKKRTGVVQLPDGPLSMTITEH